VEAEDLGADDGMLEAASSNGRQLAKFDGRHLYFGGVHSARRCGDGSFEAFGDPRRSGLGLIAGGAPSVPSDDT
jgi:hypothetical protein